MREGRRVVNFDSQIKRLKPLLSMLRSSISLLFLGTTLLTSCATLTKSQLQAVNEYATLTDKGITYPEKILNETFDGLYKARVLEGSQNVSRTKPLTYSAIVGYNADRVKGLDTLKRLKAELNVLSEYALALKKLSSPDFATTAATSADALGKSVDKVTTTIAGTAVSGVGNALSATIKAVGKRYIGARQTRAIQRFVNEGDILVDMICQSNEQFFQTNANEYINGIERSSMATANGMLLVVSGQSNVPVERFQMALATAELIARYESLRLLNRQAVQAFRQFRLAHNELKNTLKKKQNLKSVGQQLIDLYQTVNEIQTAFQEVKF